MTTNTATAGKLGFKPPSKKTQTVILLSVGIPLALVLLWKFLPMNDYLREVIDWVGKTGFMGVIGFYFIYILASVVGIPRTILHVAAGVVFSFPLAMLVVVAGAASAFTLTFTIARTVARDWVSARVAKSPNVKRLLDMVDEEGFKLVFLIRLNPFIPGVLKGYGFGTTGIGFWTYISASVLGFLPVGLAHVYLGWAGGEAMLRDNASPSELEQWLLAGGVVVSIILMTGIFVYGKRAMNRRYPEKK